MADFSNHAVPGAIKGRRSVRAYTSDRIPGEVLIAVIGAGNAAPSEMKPAVEVCCS